MVYLPAIEAVGITIPSTTVARAKASCICSSVIVNIQFYDKSSYLYYQEWIEFKNYSLTDDNHGHDCFETRGQALK